MSLTLSHVSLTVGDGDLQVTALDDIDLHVEDGELLAVVGPSGSGKSSLLAVAGALRTPDTGRVLIDDIEIERLSPKARTTLRRDRIGFVFQSSNLVPSLTAVEQLELVVHLRGQRASRGRDAAQALLDEVGMGSRADHRPGQLSGGERQRVGLARALMGQPSILLADEPTSALDHERGREIVALLAEETHRRGIATMMVTHDPSLLELSDRVVRMQDGRLVGHDPTSATQPVP